MPPSPSHMGHVGVLLEMGRGVDLWQGAVLMIQTELTGIRVALTARDQAHRDLHHLIHIVPRCSRSSQLQTAGIGNGQGQFR